MFLYLARNVRPIVLAAEGLEVLPQQGAHANDAVGHALDFALPLLVQGRVVEDRGRNPRAVDRRVRVQRPDQDLDLRLDALLLLGGCGHDREGTAAFAVQTLELVSGGGGNTIVKRNELTKPCSWQSSGTEQCYDPARQSTAAQTHPGPHHPRQSPDRPYRRRQSGPSP